jgi:hypothetical protein
MDLNTDSTPELEAFLAKLDDSDHSDRHFLPEEVRYAKLDRISDAQLEGRYAYYLRDYTFERNSSKRHEFQREVIRTRLEILRRAAKRREEAVKEALTGEFGRTETQNAA